VLPGLDVIDHSKFDTEAKIEALSETVSLRGRCLEGAVLIRAVLRKVDFTAAKLAGAVLVGADLRQAKFECSVRAMGKERSQDCSDLRGAVLDNSQMQGASLNHAQLQGASLINAQLQEASLYGAQLQGVDLRLSQLKGASLILAQLQGAWLGHTQLQAARLDLAGLQGATLDNVQLQGSSLSEAGLQGAQLQQPLVWRADPRRTLNVLSKVVEPDTGPSYLGKCGDPPIDFQKCGWSSAVFEALKQSMPGAVSDDDIARDLRDRIATLDPDRPLAGEADMAQAWKKWSESPIDEAAFQKTRLEALDYAYCNSDGASWVIHGLLSLSPEGKVDRMRSLGGEGLELLDVVLDENKCPGARGLSDQDHMQLAFLRSLFSNTTGGQMKP
jgi:uncharacterized protein YjbI with pentapeptide repeats